MPPPFFNHGLLRHVSTTPCNGTALHMIQPFPIATIHTSSLLLHSSPAVAHSTCHARDSVPGADPGRCILPLQEGENSKFQQEIVDADVLITTPFHPGYATREVIAKAKNLKACITAGVGSDHIGAFFQTFRARSLLDQSLT